jgi:hypothetical protein
MKTKPSEIPFPAIGSFSDLNLDSATADEADVL